MSRSASCFEREADVGVESHTLAEGRTRTEARSRPSQRAPRLSRRRARARAASRGRARPPATPLLRPPARRVVATTRRDRDLEAREARVPWTERESEGPRLHPRARASRAFTARSQSSGSPPPTRAIPRTCGSARRRGERAGGERKRAEGASASPASAAKTNYARARANLGVALSLFAQSAVARRRRAAALRLEQVAQLGVLRVHDELEAELARAHSTRAASRGSRGSPS